MFKLTVPVLESHLLDNLAHRKEIGGAAENVHAHPSIASIQRGHGSGGVAEVKVARNGTLDISPRSYDGA